MLGDPRIIAQTIIDTNGGEGDYSTEDTDTAYDNERYESSWHPMEETKENDDSGSTFWFHTSTPIKWYHKVLAVLIPICFDYDYHYNCDWIFAASYVSCRTITNYIYLYIFISNIEKIIQK